MIEEGECLFGYVWCLLWFLDEVSEVFSLVYGDGVLCFGVLEDFVGEVLMLVLMCFIEECL